MIPVVSHIFNVSSSTVLGIEGYLTRWKPQPRNESSKYAPTESFWGQITSPLLLATALYFLPMVPMLWHSAETPNSFGG